MRDCLLAYSVKNQCQSTSHRSCLQAAAGGIVKCKHRKHQGNTGITEFQDAGKRSKGDHNGSPGSPGVPMEQVERRIEKITMVPGAGTEP